MILLGCPIVIFQVLRFGMWKGKQKGEYVEKALIDWKNQFGNQFSMTKVNLNFIFLSIGLKFVK
jgi:hypothetical protein